MIAFISTKYINTKHCTRGNLERPGGNSHSFHRLDSDSLDLSGSLFVGGVNYMDPALSPPPQIWSASLKRGFVGCLKDLIINGADIDIVAYAHEQNSGVQADKF